MARQRAKKEEAAGERSPAEVVNGVVETSRELLEHLDPTKLPRFDDPHKAKEHPLKPGYDQIVETVFVEDDAVVDMYRQVEESLHLGERRSDRETVADALDGAEKMARLAHRLYSSAEVEKRRWELENERVFGAMWADANRALQDEKDAKKRSKAITDADVTNKACELFPDEYLHQEVKKAKVEQMCKSMKNLAELAAGRCFSLRAILEAHRR